MQRKDSHTHASRLHADTLCARAPVETKLQALRHGYRQLRTMQDNRHRHYVRPLPLQYQQEDDRRGRINCLLPGCGQVIGAKPPWPLNTADDKRNIRLGSAKTVANHPQEAEAAWPVRPATVSYMDHIFPDN